MQHLNSVLARELLFPDQGWNLGPQHWEHEVLATRPPEESPDVSYNVGNDVNLLNAPYVPGIVLKIFHDFSPLVGKIVQSKYSFHHFTDEEVEVLCH